MGGPVVSISDPTDGEEFAERFTDFAATVSSAEPLEAVVLLINGDQVKDYGAALTVSDTIIIRSGTNVIELVALDIAGQTGRDSVTIVGTFAAADIRVTQTWNVPGDMDTWLVDPQGRHMGWTAGGPGLPNSIAELIPGAFLDIDDIPGVGP